MRNKFIGIERVSSWSGVEIHCVPLCSLELSMFMLSTLWTNVYFLHLLYECRSTPGSFWMYSSCCFIVAFWVVFSWHSHDLQHTWLSRWIGDKSIYCPLRPTFCVCEHTLNACYTSKLWTLKKSTPADNIYSYLPFSAKALHTVILNSWHRQYDIGHLSSQNFSRAHFHR